MFGKKKNNGVVKQEAKPKKSFLETVLNKFGYEEDPVRASVKIVIGLMGVSMIVCILIANFL